MNMALVGGSLLQYIKIIKIKIYKGGNYMFDFQDITLISVGVCFVNMFTSRETSSRVVFGIGFIAGLASHILYHVNI